MEYEYIVYSYMRKCTYDHVAFVMDLSQKKLYSCPMLNPLSFSYSTICIHFESPTSFMIKPVRASLVVTHPQTYLILVV